MAGREPKQAVPRTGRNAPLMPTKWVKRWLRSGLPFLVVSFLAASAVEREPVPTATLELQTGIADCRVGLDGALSGHTDPDGNLTLADIEPGEHYVQIDCPTHEPGSHFTALKPGQIKFFPLQPKPRSATGYDSLEAIAADADQMFRRRQHVRRAFRYRSESEWNRAIREFRLAAPLDPTNADIHRELGITFLLMKDWRRAANELREALRLDPDSAEAHNHHGYALEKIGKLDGALKEYRTATRLDPTDSTFLQRYTNLLVRIYAEKRAK